MPCLFRKTGREGGGNIQKMLYPFKDLGKQKLEPI